MSQNLNRLTANFSTLLPVQSHRLGAIARPPIWAALTQAMDARLLLPPGRVLNPPTMVSGWLAFADLAQGLTWRQPFIPQPSGQPPLPETSDRHGNGDPGGADDDQSFCLGRQRAGGRRQKD